jgi:alanyl-tRNA synthetase
VATERLYYVDSELFAFEARVTAATALAGHPAVVLDRTAFYPTSGGQPHDRGTLGGVPVIEVVDDDTAILHLLAGPSDEAALAVGQQVRGEIDRARRWDHTQQHTGQHILSQAFERVAGGRTISFHLGAQSTTIDLDQPQLDNRRAADAEALANEIVLADRPVRVSFVDAAAVDQLGLRKPTSRTGPVRIVEIADFDRSACGGTHVPRTGQVGPIKLRRWERRGSSTRVEFWCGWRALRDYGARLTTTRTLAERLRVADDEIGPAVERALDELARLRDEVATFHEAQLRQEAAALAAAGEPLPTSPSVRLVCAAFTNRPADELKRLALAVVAAASAVALIGSGGDRRHLVFAQSPGLAFDLADLLRLATVRIGARGGGSRDLVQAGSPAPGPIDAALLAAEQAVLAGTGTGQPTA